MTAAMEEGCPTRSREVGFCSLLTVNPGLPRGRKSLDGPQRFNLKLSPSVGPDAPSQSPPRRGGLSEGRGPPKAGRRAFKSTLKSERRTM